MILFLFYRFKNNNFVNMENTFFTIKKISFKLFFF